MRNCCPKHPCKTSFITSGTTCEAVAFLAFHFGIFKFFSQEFVDTFAFKKKVTFITTGRTSRDSLYMAFSSCRMHSMKAFPNCQIKTFYKIIFESNILIYY